MRIANIVLVFLLLSVAGSNHAAVRVELDKYGGDKRIKGKATGRFTIEKIGDRFWFITPEGHGWFSLGVSVVSEWGKGYESNLAGWAKDTNKFLEATFNCIGGNHHDPSSKYIKQLRKAGTNLPYFLSLHPILSGSKTAKMKDKDPSLLYTDLFDPGTPVLFKNKLSKQIRLFKDDPYLVGVFTNNELFWGVQNWGGWWKDIVARDRNAPGKKRFTELLKERYENDFENFKNTWFPVDCYKNRSYRTGKSFKKEPMEKEDYEIAQRICSQGNSMKSWDDILDMQKPSAISFIVSVNERAWRDIEEFNGLMSAEYHKICREVLNEVAPGVLNLGTRLVGLGCVSAYSVPYSVIEGSLPYIDAISYNIYWDTKPGKNGHEEEFAASLDRLFEKTKLPVILSEMGGFHAKDHPVYGGDQDFYIPVKNQEERAKKFDVYMKQLMKLPYVIGAHYYSYIDHVNTNWGVVDEHYKPYEPICTEIRNWKENVVSYRLDE